MVSSINNCNTFGKKWESLSPLILFKQQISVWTDHCKAATKPRCQAEEQSRDVKCWTRPLNHSCSNTDRDKMNRYFSATFSPSTASCPLNSHNSTVLLPPLPFVTLPTHKHPLTQNKIKKKRVNVFVYNEGDGRKLLLVVVPRHCTGQCLHQGHIMHWPLHLINNDLFSVQQVKLDTFSWLYFCIHPRATSAINGTLSTIKQ